MAAPSHGRAAHARAQAPHTTVSGRVAYTVSKGVVVALNGQNLLKERQSQAKGISGQQAERRVMFGVSKSW